MSREEYESWYKNVDFIQENMQIYSFEDFYAKRVYIKVLYNAMNRQAKKLYQWYLYAGSIPFKKKNHIWNYINDTITDKEFVNIYEDYFKRKIDTL